MSVRPHPKKGPGYWIIDYYPAGRKGKRVRFTYKGTEGKALAMEQDARRGRGDLPDVVVPLVKDIIPAWLDFYKNEVAESTYKDAVNSMRHWLPVFGMYRPAGITQSSINLYKSQRLTEVANKKQVDNGGEPRLTKKRTINKELSYLSSCIKWAAQMGHCPELSFQIKGFPAKQTRAQAPITLTPRQIDKMYEVLEQEYKLLFILMA